MPTLDDLNPLVPGNNDGVSGAASEIRVLKDTLQDSFGANPNPLEFNSDLIFGGYLKNAQIAKAGAAVNGLTGNVLASSTGLGAGEVVRISAGTYEVQLAETGFTFDDLHASFNVNYSFAGLGIGTMIPAETNTGGDWVRLVFVSANDPTTAADPVKFSFAIFDWSR